MPETPHLVADQEKGVCARVMVVDDERTVRRCLSAVLRRAGYDVVACADGQEALTVLDAGHVDLIILDIRMPGMDGLEVLKAVRRTKPEIPVIMLTACADSRHHADTLNAGAVEFLTKPVPNETMLETVSGFSFAEKRPAPHRVIPLNVY